MHLDSHALWGYIAGYIRGLESMVNTSWLRVFDVSLQGVNCDLSTDTSVQYPGMIRDWLGWNPESLGGWLMRWLIALPVLTVIVILCLLVALAKTCLWLICLLPAMVICLLMAIRFTCPTAGHP